MPTSNENSPQPAFRIRHEPFEDENFSLELSNVPFSATNDSVTLHLTAALWEALRHRHPADLGWADATDDAIRAHVVQGVAQRAVEMQKHGAGLAHLMNLSIYEQYGAPERSAEEQIAHGIAYFQQLRTRHQDLRAEIAALNAANPT